MLKDDVGRYRCVLCGAVLDVSEDAAPRVVIAGGSGKPNDRLLVLDGVEIHRCELALPHDPLRSQGSGVTGGRGGKKSGSGGNTKQGGTTAQHKAAGR